MKIYEEAENNLQKAMEFFEKALRSINNLEVTYPDHSR